MHQHIEILGHEVRDRVTGFAGVASTVAFDLYGCIQVVVSPPADKDGKYIEGRYFDLSRLELVNERDRAMELPDFAGVGPIAQGRKGPADKPSHPSA